MTAPTARLLGAISFALAIALTMPSLVAGIGVYAALLNLLFAGLLALTGYLLWPVLTAVVTAVNVFVTEYSM